MQRLVESFPDTIIWGTDTPANYFIQKYFDANGELVDLHLKSPFDKEVRLLESLGDSDIERIAHKNTIRFLFE